MNTILFDLDGTLLPIDMKIFEKIYFKTLCEYFSDIMDAESLINHIWSSTKVMVENTEPLTNEDIFMKDFSSRVKDKFPIFKNGFNDYYNSSFLKMKSAVNFIEDLRNSVLSLKDKGYKLVLATNPLFPKDAINHRISWAGFSPDFFDYITYFEHNHYCKPQLKYYEEILRDINKKPEECLMVGNDVQEDLIAGKLGIKTYLITDNLLHKSDESICCDYKGSYMEFVNFLNSLPSLK